MAKGAINQLEYLVKSAEGRLEYRKENGFPDHHPCANYHWEQGNVCSSLAQAYAHAEFMNKLGLISVEELEPLRQRAEEIAKFDVETIAQRAELYVKGTGDRGKKAEVRRNNILESEGSYEAKNFLRYLQRGGRKR